MQAQVSDKCLTGILLRIHKRAVENGDLDLFRKICLAIEARIIIALALEFFVQCDGRIKGRAGVAKAMGISRYGVYGRLDSLGLCPEDFRERDTTVASLMLKSKYGPDIQQWLEEDHHGIESS